MHPKKLKNNNSLKSLKTDDYVESAAILDDGLCCKFIGKISKIVFDDNYPTLYQVLMIKILKGNKNLEGKIVILQNMHKCNVIWNDNMNKRCYTKKGFHDHYFVNACMLNNIKAATYLLSFVHLNCMPGGSLTSGIKISVKYGYIELLNVIVNHFRNLLPDPNPLFYGGNAVQTATVLNCILNQSKEVTTQLFNKENEKFVWMCIVKLRSKNINFVMDQDTRELKGLYNGKELPKECITKLNVKHVVSATVGKGLIEILFEEQNEFLLMHMLTFEWIFFAETFVKKQQYCNECKISSNVSTYLKDHNLNFVLFLLEHQIMNGRSWKTICVDIMSIMENNVLTTNSKQPLPDNLSKNNNLRHNKVFKKWKDDQFFSIYYHKIWSKTYYCSNLATLLFYLFGLCEYKRDSPINQRIINSCKQYISYVLRFDIPLNESCIILEYKYTYPQRMNIKFSLNDIKSIKIKEIFYDETNKYYKRYQKYISIIMNKHVGYQYYNAIINIIIKYICHCQNTLLYFKK